MSKSRCTDVVTCRLMIVVALIGSYDNCNYCRAAQLATATNYTPYVHRDQYFRSDGLWDSNSFAIQAPDDGNRTEVQRLLERTSNIVSKFLPFVTSADVHTQCYKHTTVYLTQLDDFQLWATKSEPQRIKINL